MTEDYTSEQQATSADSTVKTARKRIAKSAAKDGAQAGTAKKNSQAAKKTQPAPKQTRDSSKPVSSRSASSKPASSAKKITAATLQEETVPPLDHASNSLYESSAKNVSEDFQNTADLHDAASKPVPLADTPVSEDPANISVDLKDPTTGKQRVRNAARNVDRSAARKQSSGKNKKIADPPTSVEEAMQGDRVVVEQKKRSSRATTAAAQEKPTARKTHKSQVRGGRAQTEKMKNGASAPPTEILSAVMEQVPLAPDADSSDLLLVSADSDSRFPEFAVQAPPFQEISVPDVPFLESQDQKTSALRESAGITLAGAAPLSDVEIAEMLPSVATVQKADPSGIHVVDRTARTDSATEARNGEEGPGEASLDVLTDFPTSFGDMYLEDAFPFPGTGVEQDDAVTEIPVQEYIEKKRRSRSRRGRGRKKNAAVQQVSGIEEEIVAEDAPVDVAPDPEKELDSDDVLAGLFENHEKEEEEEEELERTPGEKMSRRKMFVSVLPEEQVEVVITEEGQVQEYYVEMLHQAKTKGNIYKGIVHNVDPNLQAAFVSYGAVKNGFLQIDEVHPEYYVSPHDPGKGRNYPPIQKVLKTGQELLVQVVKEPAGTKGAFLTTYLSMPGRFLVLTPGREQIGVSRKVENDSERSRLRELLEGLNPGSGLGVIVRTVSMGASKTSLQRDLQFLKRTWKEVRTRGSTEKAPCLVYQEMDLTSRAVRDYLTDAIGEIWIDDESTAASVTEVAEALFPRKQNLVRVHKSMDTTLFERFNIQRQLDQIHSREVALPSGGHLVIDPTEALTAIDINSGRSGGKNNFEDMAYRTNMEAAKMIPLQLRLRDIGGQVVADFIEMRDKSHWREVEKTLRNGMKVDRARYDIGKIGPFGLLEMVRQRLGSSAISVSSEPCPCCNGTGIRRNMEWQSQHALRDILRLMRNAQSQGESMVNYQAEPSVAMHLLNHKRQRLAEMEHTYGARLEIQLKLPLAL